MITFFLFLALTTLPLLPEIAFSLPGPTEATMSTGADHVYLRPARIESSFLCENTISSQNSSFTFLPDHSYYEPPQGVRPRYSYSERATLQSLSAEDFRYIASKRSNILDLLTDYELYAYPAFCEFARTLACYPNFMIALEKKMMADKSFKRKTTWIFGFNYKFWPFGEKSGFRDFVHAEVRMIKEKQAAAQELAALQKIKKSEIPEPDLHNQKLPHLDLGNPLDLELFTQECSDKITELKELDAPQALITRIADRIDALEKTISQKFIIFDYAQDLDQLSGTHSPGCDDPYALIFKNCSGTHIDRQLHKELCQARNTISSLEAHYTKSHHIAIIGPAVHQLAAKAKTETDLLEAFDLSDLCHMLSECASTGMHALIKGSCALGKGLYAGTRKALTFEHAQDLALGIGNAAALWVLGALWVGEYGHATCSSALSLDLQPLHDKITADAQLLKKHTDQLSQSLHATYKKLETMPWHDLLESGSEVGITIGLDMLASGALGRFANTTGRIFARDMVQALNRGILFSTEYAIELAGLAKIALSEGLQSATTIKNHITAIHPSFFTQSKLRAAPQKWVCKKIKNKQLKVKNHDFSKQAQAATIHHNHRRLVDMIRNVGDDILDHMEKLGGHTLSRHVGQTKEALLERLKTAKSISGASSFYNKRIANKATKEVLRKNMKAIAAWLQNKPEENRLTILLTHKQSLGFGILKESTQEIMDLTDSLTILERTAITDLGFKVLTIFPQVK